MSEIMVTTMNDLPGYRIDEVFGSWETALRRSSSEMPHESNRARGM